MHAKIVVFRSLLVCASTLSLLLAGGCGSPATHENRRSQEGISISLRQRMPDGCREQNVKTSAMHGFSEERLIESTGKWNSLVQSVKKRLQKQLPQGLRPQIVSIEQSGGATHYDVSFYARQQRICGHSLRVSALNGRIFGDDVGPLKDGPVFAGLQQALPWPRLDASLMSLAAYIDDDMSETNVVRRELCLAAGGSGYVPASELLVTIAGHPYFAIVDEQQVYYLEERALHATGAAQVHPRNPLVGARVEVPLYDLVGDGRLASSRFVTVLPKGQEFAQFFDHRFDVSPEDPRYAEIAAFVHAEDMYAWMTRPEHDYASECLPLEIEMHASFRYRGQTTINNAEYVPAELTGTARPRIRIGDGDGVSLRNLAYDYDVVAHELGHHVLFRRLRSQAGESGVIHEALSDYLLFARTENACLGESICPEGGTCFVPGKCLRTALNDLKLTDPDLPVLAHHRSQFLSGMLWDIGTHPQMGHAKLASLIFASVNFLQSASGYRDLVKALMLADLAKFGGAHACLIQKGAWSRGLADLLGGVDCRDFTEESL